MSQWFKKKKVTKHIKRAFTIAEITLKKLCSRDCRSTVKYTIHIITTTKNKD